jgi:4-aminobutyrate aminotransferase
MAISKAFAHGLPAGAAVARAEVMDWGEGAHEGTLNGGPVIMEAAKAVLRVIDREKLVEKSRIQGEYLKRMLEALKEKYPLIGDVRGMGLMVGIELIADARKTPAKEKRDRLIEEAFTRGLLLLGAGESSVRLAPPLVITREQIDMGLSIFEDCLKLLG